EGALLVGHRARPGGWEPVRAKVACVYDRFPSQREADRFRALLAGLGATPVANPPALTALCRDKVASQRRLEAAGVRMPPLEDDADRQAVRLADWGAAFLKPRFGSFGAGVRRVVPGDPLPRRLVGVLPGVHEPAVLQRAVPPLGDFAGVSVRVLCQRAPDGGWAAMAGVARVSADDPVVNHARGAEVRPAEEIGRA